MNLIRCAVFVLVAWEVHAACKVTLQPPAARAGLICGQRGHLTPNTAEQQFIRQIYQSTAAQCASICRYSKECKLSSHVLNTGECRHYTNDASSFVADTTSNRAFSDPACYKRPTTCVILNGNFEDKDVTGENGKARITPRPPAKVLTAPWETTEGDQYSVTSNLRRFSNQKLGTLAQPTPDGSLFGLVNVNGDDTFVFQQILSLKPNTQYQLSFIYNFIAFQGKTGVSSNNYNLKVGYGPRAFLDSKYLSITLDPDDADSRGVWQSDSFEFRTSTDANQGIFFGVTATPFSDSQTRGVFGFDAIQVAEVF